MTILELGGKILDVVVEHELYGQIRVDLMIESQQDAQEFYEKLMQSKDEPLKILTGDCHPVRREDTVVLRPHQGNVLDNNLATYVKGVCQGGS